MEQQIRFCTTSDGVRIAYATAGQGPPVVFVPGWISHLELDWDPPWLRQWWESVAQRFTVVRFDKRGNGLSDKGFAEYSVDAWVSDLEAVTGHLGLHELALEGVSEGGPVAIAYAARHPQRVSKLILYGTFSGGEEDRRDDLIDALVKLVQAEWGLGSEAMANLLIPGASPEIEAWFIRHQREGTTREDAIAMLRALPVIDVSHLLPQITAPTLIVHGRQDRAMPFEWARNLAGSIPDARLFPFEGGHLATDPDIQASVQQAILEFLSEGEDTTEDPAQSGLVTILFTDIESSAALRQRLGDAKAQDLVHTHDSIVRDALKSHQGREIKHTGDGIMSSFSTASSALDAAIAIQRGIAAHVQENPDAPLGVYIGLNAGEPIAEEKDLFGTSVDLARRICDHAQPGQVLVSDVVRQLAAGKNFLFSDFGETEMRGFEDPVRLYEVRWREDG